MSVLSSSTHVLVAGASGSVGRHVVEQLLSRGCRVTALCRNASKLSTLFAGGVSVVEQDVRAVVVDDLVDVDVVVSAVGGSVMPGLLPRQGFDVLDVEPNLHLVGVAREAGIGHFAYVSAAGAGDAAPDEGYVGAHAAVEHAIREAGFASHSLVRPVGLHSAFAALVPYTWWRVFPVMGAGDVVTNPVAEADLAAVLVDVIDAGGGVRDVGGPDVLRRKDIAQAVAASAGRRCWHPSVSLRWVRLAAWMLSLSTLATAHCFRSTQTSMRTIASLTPSV